MNARNDSVLGTTFETALRIVLMLEAASVPLNSRRIQAYDYIAVYGADFDLLDENLHGSGAFRFSEYAARKELIDAAIKELALKGLLEIKKTACFEYRLSKIGYDFAASFTSDYANDYRVAIDTVIRAFEKWSDTKLTGMIEQKIISSLEGGLTWDIT